MGRQYDPDYMPDDADELRAKDRKICRHQSGDPDCDCHETDQDAEGDEV